MKIGSLGDIIFEVSPNKTMTPKDMERSGSARWNDHEIIGQKPKSEFSGPSLEDMRLTILLKAELGINPIKQIEKLRKMRDMGTVALFLLGGKPVSQNHWSLQRIVERHQNIDNKGNLLSAEVDIDLKEYVMKKKKPATSKKAVTSNKSASKPVTTPKPKTLGKITIKVKSVNIRSGPSTSARVIGYAYNGNTLTVLSMSNGWYSLGQGKYITANSAYSTLKKG